MCTMSFVLGGTGPAAGYFELQDHRVVKDSVYRRRRRRRVCERLLPLAEHQVRGDAQPSTLIALGIWSEQDLRLRRSPWGISLSRAYGLDFPLPYLRPLEAGRGVRFPSAALWRRRLLSRARPGL